MMRKQAVGRACLVVVWCFLTASTMAAPPDPGFAASKQSFLKEMRKKSAAARIEAINTIAENIHPEAAELLIKRAAGDDDATVRQAARTGLRKLADDTAIRQYLFDELKKTFRKTPANENTIEIFRALAVTDDEDRQAEIVKTLDEYLAAPKGNLLVPITVIDDMSLQGDDEAMSTVTLLGKAKAFEQNFGYRRCVVQAMTAIRKPEAVDFLIDLLPKTQGLIQYDVIQYLSRLTKQRFGDHDRNWTNWWKDNRKEFQFPAVGVALPEIAVDEKQPTYYGIPICAKRIVFVLDTSGSMRGPPIDAAKQALLKVVESLPEAVAFDIITFDNTAVTWQPRLVPATYEAKQFASRMIIERELRLGTASNDALQTAFRLEPEAIYFLSDGEPTDGQPNQIVNSITQMNRTRRVSINAIGVVTQRNGTALTMFMQPLANKNFGAFHLVE